MLVVVAAGSGLLGALVPAMVAAAAWVFGLAGTALVAYSVSRLGVLTAVERLLRFWRPSGRPSERPQSRSESMPAKHTVNLAVNSPAEEGPGPAGRGREGSS